MVIIKILGIDISLTSCGISIIDDNFFNDNKVFTNSIKLDFSGITKLPYLEQEQKKNERLIAIEKEIIKYAKDVDYVVIENYAFDAKFNREKLGELHGIIKRRLYLMDKPYLLIDTHKLKKVLTGDSRNPTKLPVKKWVVQETFNRYNLDFKDKDDECDAFGLSLIGLCFNNSTLLENPLISNEIKEDIEEVICKIVQQKIPKIKKNLSYYFNLPYNISVIKENDEYVSILPIFNLQAKSNTIKKSLVLLEKQKNQHIRELRKNKKRISLKVSERGRISYIIKRNHL